MMLVQTREQFEAARSHLALARVVAIDTETTGLWFHQGDRIIGISTYCLFPGDSTYSMCFYFPFRHEPKEMDLFTLSENLDIEWMSELRDVICRQDLTVIFHNSKFDLKMMRKDGLEINPATIGKLYDTMVMAQMVDENSVHSLKGLAELHFGPGARDEERRIKKLVNKLGGWNKTSAKQMAPYACKDAELTYKLCEVLGNELVAQDLMPLWASTEEPLLHLLKEMEWTGIEVDFALASQLSEQARRRMRELEDEIGFDPLKLDLLARNLHAPPPEGLGIPYDREKLSKTRTSEFPLGRPEMGEDILQRYEHPLVDSILEYRGLVKANSTWYFGWMQKASPDQRIHPQYNSADKKEKYGTVTGRLSSSYPNIQQMPRSKDSLVKKLLLPSPGHRLIEFDYSQAELRLASCYAEDKAYIEAFNRGVDAHADTAERVGITRQAAKHAAFTVIYGGAAPTLARTIERLEWQEEKRRIHFDDAEAKAILDAYFTLHPNLRKMGYKTKRTAEVQGYIRLWNGKRRHFRRDEPWTYRKAFNSLIQGGISQIMVETMLKIGLDKPYRMALQVHDSIWFEVPIDGEEEHCKEIKTIMEWPSDKFAVPFPVDMKVMRDREERVTVSSV
jgi:DNA polymerase-1